MLFYVGPATEWFPDSANDISYQSEQVRCAEACAAFNSLGENTNSYNKTAAFLRIFPSLDPMSRAPTIKTPFYVEYGLRVDIHPSAFIDRGCKIFDTPVAKILISDGCSIGPDVTILSAGPPHPSSRLDGSATGAPITIHSRAVIGGRALIGPGVTIGSRAVVEVGSVVLDDVPASVKVRGNPARIVGIVEKDKDDEDDDEEDEKSEYGKGRSDTPMKSETIKWHHHVI
ncbi:hypothetical protein AAE478_008432 [Parahypoxylon ruwenzoriense]